MRESWEGLRSGRRGGSVDPYGQETFTLCTRQPRRSPLSSMGCARHPEAEKARPPGRAVRRHAIADYPHHASIARRRSSHPTAGAPSPLTPRRPHRVGHPRGHPRRRQRGQRGRAPGPCALLGPLVPSPLAPPRPLSRRSCRPAGPSRLLHSCSFRSDDPSNGDDHEEARRNDRARRDLFTAGRRSLLSAPRCSRRAARSVNRGRRRSERVPLGLRRQPETRRQPCPRWNPRRLARLMIEGPRFSPIVSRGARRAHAGHRTRRGSGGARRDLEGELSEGGVHVVCTPLETKKAGRR